VTIVRVGAAAAAIARDDGLTDLATTARPRPPPSSKWRAAIEHSISD